MRDLSVLDVQLDASSEESGRETENDVAEEVAYIAELAMEELVMSRVEAGEGSLKTNRGQLNSFEIREKNQLAPKLLRLT